MNQTEAYNNYLETRNIEGGLKIIDGQAIVPKELKEEVIKTEDIFQLKKYVTVVPVEHKSGSAPVQKETTEVLEEVDELEETPKIEENPFAKVNFNIKTKRGLVKISLELLEDGNKQLKEMINSHVAKLEANTENSDIMKVLNTINATNITTVEELESLYSLLEEFENRTTKVYVTQKAYNQAHKAGLVEESILFKSGKSLLNKELISIEGTDNLMFIGNLKEVVYFDREATSVNFQHHRVHGLGLQVAVRNDVTKLDDSNIKKVILNIN